MVEYGTKTGSVPVGDTFKSVKVNGRRIERGDLYMWEDRDAGLRDQEIRAGYSVGKVDTIYRLESDTFENEPQVSLKASGVGRLDVEDLEELDGRPERVYRLLREQEDLMNGGYIEIMRDGQVNITAYTKEDGGQPVELTMEELKRR